MKKYHVMLINGQDHTIQQITEKSLSWGELNKWTREFIELNKELFNQPHINISLKEERSC